MHKNAMKTTPCPVHFSCAGRKAGAASAANALLLFLKSPCSLHACEGEVTSQNITALVGCLPCPGLNTWQSWVTRGLSVRPGGRLVPRGSAALPIASLPRKDLQGSSRAWDGIACCGALVMRPASSVVSLSPCNFYFGFGARAKC